MFTINDQIIDAMLQNEKRGSQQARIASAPKRPFPAASNLANLKPDWCQLPPDSLGTPTRGER